jgi:ABC-2 type transport system ATP-binding protein
MLMRPQLLILDEPWEGLDATARELVPDLVRSVADAGGTVLISDHRGETAKLPGATHWTLADGTLSIDAQAGARHSIIEIAVPAARVATTADELRAAGHDIVRIRTQA